MPVSFSLLLGALFVLASADMSPCGAPPPEAPLGTLMNNTRLNYAPPPPAPYNSPSAARCLADCVSDAQCGGIVYAEPYEPIPVGACRVQPSQGCCYPAPLADFYEVIGPGAPVTFGFVSAIVRHGPPSPPRGVPPGWEPTYEMNRSISLYWRNATGIEPAEYYDGYGLVMFDWAHAAQDWINNYQPMDNAASLARQCEVVKGRNPLTRCIVYRNVRFFARPGPQHMRCAQRPEP